MRILLLLLSVVNLSKTNSSNNDAGHPLASARGGSGHPSTRGVDCEAGTNNTFTFRVNFHTGGLLGEYEVEGCNGTSPTLILERDKTYTMIQEDVTNWMHPLGFAYYPDGAHGFKQYAEVPELEEPHPETCNEQQFLCNPNNQTAKVRQAPLYGIDGVFETLDNWNDGTSGGLDVYEPGFQVPQDQWKEHKYAVQLTIPRESKTQTFFYFCHIHSGMSGMIKVKDPASGIFVANKLVQSFDPSQYYAKQSHFDAVCGTSEVSNYHESKEYFCPNMNFLCEKDDNPQFSRCMEAIDCKMNYEMRVEEHSNPLVVFMHQMIPHHENAVNMARIALKHAKSGEGFNDETLDVPALLRDIINTQNKQIQDMQGWLERYGRETPQYCPPPTSLPSGASVKDTTSSGLATMLLIVASVFLVRSNICDI